MPQSPLTAQELADRLGGTLRNCPGDRVLGEVLPLDEAHEGALSFLANPRYRSKALASKAGLILADPEADLPDKPQLLMKNPYWGFAQALAFLHPEPALEINEIPVHATARLGVGVRIGLGSTVGARTTIGASTILHPGVHVGPDCRIGDDCELFPGVVLYRRTLLGNRVRIHANSVLGAEGYGYALADGRHEKIVQAGWVDVEDDVEIGACTTVDRGAMGPTRIGAGTKIDNLCQLAHNVQTGRHCLIVSQTGIAGSTTLGDYVTLAAKAGLGGHIHIGSRSIVGGNSMVAKDLPEGSRVTGYLARPHREWLASQAALNRLPAILKRLGRVLKD